MIRDALTAAHLDGGETDALALALEVHADTVLIDAGLGRHAARSLGLHVTGLLGCLVLAKQRGHLSAIIPVISELQMRAGCGFDESLIADVRVAAGED